ncbi:extracellular solute-binding protein [Cohnella sp. GCM10020058]|uniref:extracellular solute-binding protein n=1 Tax=Cohnella sp. GCM10020058 TaxID=3317330 RepID=UPI00362BEAB8
MKTSKKVLTMLMAAGLTASALTACSSESNGNQLSSLSAEGSGSAAASSAGNANGKKVGITVSMFDRGAVAADEGSYENNRWTKWINENAPAAVKWVPVPRNEAQTKLNTLIASGSAPDLMWDYDRNYIAQLANNGAIQPIGDYIEKYSTTYKNYLNEHPELKSYLNIDSKMYAVASVRGPEAIANHGIWIRQDWLDKLNLQAPTTVDELIEVARKFRDEDPDGDGKKNTVPIVFNGNGNTIMRSFFQTHENQWYLEGDKLEFGRVNDRTKDYLAFQKQLFDEGLIDKEYITDKNFQRATQFWTTGQAGILLGAWNMENEFMDLKKNVPTAKMTAMEPVASKYGKSGLYQETPANIYVTFNSQMKEDKIEAAIKYLDWMLDSGWKPLKYGEENVHYKLVDGVPQTIDAAKFKQEVAYASEYAVVNQYALKPEWFPTMAASDAISQEYAKEKANSLSVAMKNEYRRDIAYNPSLPEVSELVATFAPIAVQIETKVVTGAMTPDAGMVEIRKEWNRLGGENVEKLVNEWYQANKDQLK